MKYLKCTIRECSWAMFRHVLRHKQSPFTKKLIYCVRDDFKGLHFTLSLFNVLGWILYEIRLDTWKGYWTDEWAKYMQLTIQMFVDKLGCGSTWLILEYRAFISRYMLLKCNILLAKQYFQNIAQESFSKQNYIWLWVFIAQRHIFHLRVYPPPRGQDFH